MEVTTMIVLFFIVIISSAAEDVKNLTGTEGGSITLPDPVVEFGFLSFGSKTIAMINERKLSVVENLYRDRILWDSSSGLFTITGLQRNDSGIYNIDSKKGRVLFTTYKLKVYEPVLTPAARAVSVSPDRCILLCFVDRLPAESSLLWYRGEETVNQSSSVLSLPLTVHEQDFTSSHRCVAANPAGNKTILVDVNKTCSEENPHNNDVNGVEWKTVIGVLIPIMLTLTVLLMAFVIKRKHSEKNKGTTQTQENGEPEIQYADVHINEDRRNQGRAVPDGSETVDRSKLTTVYDKLEAHRMIPPYADTADHDQTPA